MNVAVPESLSYAELVDGRPVAVDWLWHGFAARGNVTLLTSQWKSGKTTLLSVLMARCAPAASWPGAQCTPLGRRS